MYCDSRRVADNFATELDVLSYHSGTSDVGLQAFITGKQRVLFTTTALGMGFHYPFIRHVIHYHVAFNAIAYCQETGRGGRDGKRCEVITFSLRGAQPRKMNTSFDLGESILLEWLHNSTQCRRHQLAVFMDGQPITCSLIPDAQLCDNCVQRLCEQAPAQLITFAPRERPTYHDQTQAHSAVVPNSRSPLPSSTSKAPSLAPSVARPPNATKQTSSGTVRPVGTSANMPQLKPTRPQPSGQPLFAPGYAGQMIPVNQGAHVSNSMTTRRPPADAAVTFAQPLPFDERLLSRSSSRSVTGFSIAQASHSTALRVDLQHTHWVKHFRDPLEHILDQLSHFCYGCFDEGAMHNHKMADCPLFDTFHTQDPEFSAFLCRLRVAEGYCYGCLRSSDVSSLSPCTTCAHIFSGINQLALVQAHRSSGRELSLQGYHATLRMGVLDVCSKREDFLGTTGQYEISGGVCFMAVVHAVRCPTLWSHQSLEPLVSRH